MKLDMKIYVKKILFILICILIFITFFCNYTYGFDITTSIWDQGTQWISLGKNYSSDISVSDTSYWNIIAGVLTGVGLWAILISGAILGIRFMLVTPEKRAQVKHSLMIWLIGSIVIIGALSIWRLLVNLLDVF